MLDLNNNDYLFSKARLSDAFDNQNVFIAECKFWGGKKLYQDTIDQLLGYVTYRDTKTAILIFNRNKDFSNVLEEIGKATIEHRNYVLTDNNYIPPDSVKDSAFRYKFKNKNDPDKHFYITVMAFDIPKD